MRFRQLKTDRVTVRAWAKHCFLRQEPEDVQSCPKPQSFPQFNSSRDGLRVSGWSFGHEAPNHPGRMTEDMTFEIRQRFFPVRTSALLLE